MTFPIFFSNFADIFLCLNLFSLLLVAEVEVAEIVREVMKKTGIEMDLIGKLDTNSQFHGEGLIIIITWKIFMITGILPVLNFSQKSLIDVLEFHLKLLLQFIEEMAEEISWLNTGL